MPGSLSIPTPVMAQASTPNFESESPHSPPQQEDPPTVVAEDVPAHVSPSIPVEDVQSESESIDWISTILSLLQLVAEFIILAVCGVVRLILFVCAPWLKKREEKEVVVEAFTMRKDIPSILVPSAATTTTTTTTLSSSSSLNTVVVVDDSPPLRIHLPDHAHHAILATSPAAERTPLVAERIRRKITDSVVNARRRLALVRRPYVHLETDLVVEEGSVAPLPIDQHAKERAQRTRKDANTCIRECLRRLPVGDLESTLRVHACTWNVDQCDPPPPQDASYVRWLVGAELSAKIFGYFTHAAHGGVSTELEGRRAEIEDELPDMIIVSLQEVDMRGIALVRESTKSSARWTDGIVNALQHTCSPFSVNFKKLHLVQLVGLVLLVFVQSKHVPYISHVQLSMTRTGALGMLGNKGSVAMRATIYGKRFLFIAAHFEAHKQNERNRAANYRSALNDLCFDMNENVNDESDILNTFECAIAQTGVVVEDPELNIAGTRPLERVLSAIGDRMSVSTANRVLDLHDYVFFVGDLNARLHAIRRDAIDNHIAKKEYDLLLCHDELRQGMIVGEVFDGFQEPIITFPPTYKFDRCSDAYDTSSDRRDPAWTDRVLFRVLRTVHDDNVVAEEPHSLPLSTIQRSRTTEALRRGSGSGSHAMARSVGAPHPSTILGTHETLDEDGEWITLHSIEHVAHNDDDDDDYSVENSDDVSISDDENPFQSQATRSLSRRCLSTTEDFRGSDAETFRAVRRPPTVTQTASIVANQVRVLEYTSVPDLRISDHRPVCARFDVAVLSIAPRVVYQILSEVRRVVGDEEGGLSRRSVSRRILK